MVRTLNILTISNYSYTNSARPEVNIFIELAKLGHRVKVITYPGTAFVDDLKKAGVVVVEKHPTKKLQWKSIRSIRRILTSEKIDILHMYNSTAISNGVWAAIGLPTKVIIYRGYPGNIHWYDPVQYFKFLHPRIDYIICNAQNVAQWFQKQLFFKKSKAVTIQKGHSVHWFKNVIAKDLSNLHIDPKDFVISVVANDRPIKGVHVLLESIGLLPTNLNIHFLMIGNGMDNKRNLEIIQNYKHKDRIHFLGYQSDPLSWVKASNAMIMPSIGAESLTKSIIEAACLEVAPLLSDLPGNKDLFVQGESCLKFPPNDTLRMADSIVRVYEDRELCTSLGINARKFIDDHLNINDTVSAYQELYDRII